MNASKKRDQYGELLVYRLWCNFPLRAAGSVCCASPETVLGCPEYSSDNLLTYFSFSLSFFFLNLSLWERESASTVGREGQRKKKGEHLKQTPHWAQSLTRVSIPEPCDHDLNQNQQSDAQPTGPLRHPPILTDFSCIENREMSWIIKRLKNCIALLYAS